jgi:hypothetical protein
MESLSVGEIRSVDGRILWLVEGFDKDGKAICRHKFLKSRKEGWAENTHILFPNILLVASKHYGYLITDMENE